MNFKGGHRSERIPNGFISGPVHRKKYEPDRRSGPVRFIDFTGSVRFGSQILPVGSGPVHRFHRSGSVRFIDLTSPVRSGLVHNF